jgi:PAS domain S-box-containing protein
MLVKTDECATGAARLDAPPKLETPRDSTASPPFMAALQASEECYRALLARSFDCVFLNDFTGRFLDANQAALDLLGYQRAEITSLTFASLLTPDQLPLAMQVVEEIRTTGSQRQRQKFNLRCRDGRQVVVETQGTLIFHAGQPVAIQGVARDITELQQAMAVLRESEEKFRAIINVSPVPMALNDEQLQITFLNPAFTETFGYIRADIPTVAEWFPKAYPDPAYRQSVMTAWQAEMLHAKQTGAAFSPLECVVSCKNGSSKTVLINAAPLSNTFTGNHLVVLYDITARKQAEAARNATGRFAQATIDALVTHLCVLDEHGVILAANHAWDRFARENSPAVHRSWTTVNYLQVCDQVTGPEAADAAAFAAGIRAVIAGVRPEYVLEYPCHSPAESRWFIGRVTRFCEAGTVRAVVTHENITERKRAEDQMKLQFSALSAAANAILITDRRGTIEWVNPSFTKLTGYPAAEAIGQNPRLLKSGQHPRAFYATMWTTIATGNVWHGELINQHKDGRHYTEEMTITPVREQDGSIAHFVAIKQDVTERRQLENQLQQAQKMDAVGTLAGGIAHDFNNILAAVIGYGHLLQQDTAGNAEAQESVAEILTAATRAKELVKQILSFTRKREPNRQLIRLDAVIAEAMKFLRASLPAQIKIEMQLAPDAPAMLADPTQIYQVVLNLATNAFHAMDGRPGQLTLGLAAFEPDEVFLRTHPEFRAGLCSRLTVADTGHGMDTKTMARIFEPFFTTKTVGKGTGLGLAVVHGIIHSHEGIITVDSQVGAGTTFQLYFPAQAQAADAVHEGAQDILPGDRQKILVVDDETALTGVYQRLLGRLNYQVTCRNHPSDALALVRANPMHFDLVITDLTMPGMDGLELAHQLHVLRPELPVILASGFSATVNIEDMRAAGIYELLDKPITPPTLADVVHRALAVASHGQALP